MFLRLDNRLLGSILEDRAVAGGSGERGRRKMEDGMTGGRWRAVELCTGRRHGAGRDLGGIRDANYGQRGSTEKMMPPSAVALSITGHRCGFAIPRGHAEADQTGKAQQGQKCLGLVCGLSGNTPLALPTSMA